MPLVEEVRIVNRVRQLRNARAMTQEMLAAAAGVARITVTRLEQNRANQPSVGTAIRIAQALGVEIGDLVEFEAA